VCTIWLQWTKFYLPTSHVALWLNLKSSGNPLLLRMCHLKARLKNIDLWLARLPVIVND
jgi:hypothetical protein